MGTTIGGFLSGKSHYMHAFGFAYAFMYVCMYICTWNDYEGFPVRKFHYMIESMCMYVCMYVCIYVSRLLGSPIRNLSASM